MLRLHVLHTEFEEKKSLKRHVIEIAMLLHNWFQNLDMNPNSSGNKLRNFLLLGDSFDGSHQILGQLNICILIMSPSSHTFNNFSNIIDYKQIIWNKGFWSKPN